MNPTGYDVSHLPELTPRAWVPVPDEGWTPSPATADNPHVRLLNGTWDFALRPRDRQRGWRDLDGRRWRWDPDADALKVLDHDPATGLDATFMKVDAGEVDWQPIAVPGHWETQGFSSHVFAHQSLPRDDVVGYYRRWVEVPASWLEGGRVLLGVEGIAASAEVWLNERFAIYHDGGFVPFQVDVTDLLRAGDNLLAIRVAKADISTVHDNAGQWMLSGIWRDVFLFHVPEAHVTDFEVDQDFDPEARVGRLDIALRTSVDRGEVEAVLLPFEAGEPIVIERAAVADGEARIRLESGAILPWTPETPHLYRLECRLIVTGEVVERVREEVGFRRFHADGERFLINGVPFTIRGVTRHEIRQCRGRALTLADMEQELRLLRRANVNGVRSHPYPFDPRFIKLCARHGIVVCTEFCLCGYNSWGNPWTLSERRTYPEHEATFDAGYRHLFQQRYWAFAPWIYARFRNCTAIFAWSLANESAISEIMFPVARFLRQREAERFILSAGESNMMRSRFYDRVPEQRPLVEHVRRNLLTADAEHYPERRTLEALRRSLPLLPDRPRPTFYTEAAHVFCNRDHFLIDPGILGDTWGRGLQRFFDAVRHTPGAGGYFVFEWCDQSVLQKGDPAQDDGFIRPWHGYKTYVQNLKGVLGPNLEPKPSFHSLRKAYAPVRFAHTQGPDGRWRLRVDNVMHFRDLDSLRFSLVRVHRDGARAAPEPITLRAAPGQGTVIDLPPAGREVVTLLLEVRDPASSAWPDTIAEHEISLGERPWPGADARPRPTRLRLDGGQPAGLADDQRELPWLSPLQPLWGLADPRAPQRDLGMGHLAADAMPDDVVGPSDIERVELLEHEPRRRRTRHHLRHGRGTLDCELRWHVDPDGAVVIAQTVQRDGDPIWFTGVGLTFRLPGDYDVLRWRRRGGQWHDYPDDHPDRLAGEVRLAADEHPPINPFRIPTWSALPHIRHVDRALLTGLRRPGLLLIAEGPDQRLAVRTRPDGSRDILLLIEPSCNLPWHEFSFFRGNAIREELMDVHPLRPEEPWRQTWRLSLTTGVPANDVDHAG